MTSSVNDWREMARRGELKDARLRGEADVEIDDYALHRTFCHCRCRPYPHAGARSSVKRLCRQAAGPFCESALTSAAFPDAADRHRPMMEGERDRYRAIVARAEAIAMANAEDMPSIPAICRELSVSQRTLRNAFRRVHGQSPCRRLRVLRLNQARQALLAPDGETARVTKIAVGFGFCELGRFSVEYRKLFGESPSQTLRSAGR